MTEQTRFYKEENEKKLSGFKLKARKQAWKLKKDNYIVFFEKNLNVARLHKAKQPYIYELIEVHEIIDNRYNLLLQRLHYDDLTLFFDLIQAFKKEYGKKNIHNYTNDIVKRVNYYKQQKRRKK